MSADGGKGGGRGSVRVSILGDDYTIRTDAPAGHTRDVAAHVDRVIRQVMDSGTVVETHKAAILAALQITDELFRARADARQLGERAEGLAAEVRRWLPPTKRGEGAG
ncbi:cell division protein ZapA [Roseisolibacter sp. H3M3-2]|uniref:cell division protein ZapA n=1 Tax=Roseisolibacter sp. H3M3-2 TaxID=3031323 RepID=UPI0023DAE18A|nr:cell division protein ZapA [Roseisolibacter sp. H3M3-2]MDF1505663.1 cell division protein ZapA [Roseisolibacter sp. H3M3-2]